MKRADFYTLTNAGPVARSGYIYDSGRNTYGIDNRGTVRPLWSITDLATGLQVREGFPSRKAAAEAITEPMDNIIIRRHGEPDTEPYKKAISDAYKEKPLNQEKRRPIKYGYIIEEYTTTDGTRRAYISTAAHPDYIVMDIPGDDLTPIIKQIKQDTPKAYFIDKATGQEIVLLSTRNKAQEAPEPIKADETTTAPTEAQEKPENGPTSPATVSDKGKTTEATEAPKMEARRLVAWRVECRKIGGDWTTYSQDQPTREDAERIQEEAETRRTVSTDGKPIIYRIVQVDKGPAPETLPATKDTTNRGTTTGDTTPSQVNTNGGPASDQSREPDAATTGKDTTLTPRQAATVSERTTDGETAEKAPATAQERQHRDGRTTTRGSPTSAPNSPTEARHGERRTNYHQTRQKPATGRQTSHRRTERPGKSCFFRRDQKKAEKIRSRIGYEHSVWITRKP